MAPSPSPEHGPGVDLEALLDVAESSILDALSGRPPVLGESAPRKVVRGRSGAFVTLTVGGALNGCMGALDTDEPLGPVVARMARAAAFDDPRLPPLRSADLPRLTIEVAVLSPTVPLEASLWQDLVDAVSPGIDGVLVQCWQRRAVLLPAVWERIPEPSDFISQLFTKAGIRPGSWPRGTEAFRFTTQEAKRALA